jgi:hypothetical protein
LKYSSPLIKAGTDTRQPGVEVGGCKESQRREVCQVFDFSPTLDEFVGLRRSQKRQLDVGDDGDKDKQGLPPRRPRKRRRPAPLSERNLTLFDKMGRRDKGKGYGLDRGRGPSKGASSESTSDKSSTTKTLSATASGFAMQATKNGILDPSRSDPPANIDEIRAWHERARETPSPTKTEFEYYAHLVGGAQNEQTTLVQTAPRILKDAMKKGYTQVFNQAWTAYDKDASFSQGLSAPQPDFAEGLEYPEFLPVPVDEQLAGAVVQNDNPRSLVLPHLAGEWTGSGRDMDEAQRQAAYDGAAMVSGRNEALALMGQTDPPGHSEVTTFATDGIQLNYYTHHATVSEHGTLKYHQYQFASENIKDSHEGHKRGRRALRNHQQRAMDNSYAMQEKLKAYWKSQQRGHPLRIGEGRALKLN